MSPGLEPEMGLSEQIGFGQGKLGREGRLWAGAKLHTNEWEKSSILVFFFKLACVQNSRTWMMS